MDLQSPSTLLAAWLLAPLVTVVAAGGLGTGLTVLTGVRLGALTLPLGYAAGIVLMVALLKVGLGGGAVVAITAVLALAGYALWLRAARNRGAADVKERAPSPCAAAVGGFALAMAPLVGSGRAGVLGYILNNDPTVHASLVEQLRDDGAEPPARAVASSWTDIGQLFDDGYPLGSHVWPLFSSTLSSLDAFYVWTPSIAVAAAMLSLVAFAALRRLGAAEWPAAIAAALIPAGYLFFSFIAQGSAKEVVVAVGVYGAVVAGAEVLERGLSARNAALVAVAPAAAFLTFGAGAGAWLALPALVFVLLAVRRRPAFRLDRRIAIAAALAVGVALVAGALAVAEALDYVSAADESLRDPAQHGNLLGAVPWQQAFNVWFAYDYRADPATYETLSAIGPWLAAAFAAGGLVFALRRRDLALPVIVLAGATGAIVISQRYSIYLDTKGYAILGPALGISTATGVLALLGGAGARRLFGAAAAAVIGGAVLAGAALVYAGAWVTPEDRFEEIDTIADRFRGEGPILINEREEWAYYLLRDLDPVESWGQWQHRRGLRLTGNGPPPLLPHVPDFDDYRPDFLQRFQLLLERKGPAGSRPPLNYAPAHETTHYRVWRREGEAPAVHLSLGSDGYDSSAPLDCAEPRVRRVLRTAARTGRELAAMVPASEPLVVIGPDAWRGHETAEAPPASGFINRRGGTAAVSARLHPGRYDAWIQGGFGPGVRLVVGDTAHGDVFGDLALPTAWHPLGEVAVESPDVPISLISLGKPWWQSGSKRSDMTGRLVFVPSERPTRTVTVQPEDARELCGRRLDWVALPAG